MQLAPRRLPSPPTGPESIDCDRPFDVEAGRDVVTVAGPLAKAITMTADAAIETAHRLFEAGLAAKRAARAAISSPDTRTQNVA